MAAFFRGVGQLPMDRSAAKDQESLNAGGQVLRMAVSSASTPKAPSSPDGRGYRPKVGVARLALETGVPVVPVGQIGTDLIPALRLKPCPSVPRRQAHSGAHDYRQAPQLRRIHRWLRCQSHRVQREIADRIGSEIRALSGQEYVDVYADRVKKIMTDKNMSADAASHTCSTKQ